MTLNVTVHIHLAEGVTAESAEIDDMEPRTYTIDAATPEGAKEQALDLFHADVAIGVLDDVYVIAEIESETEA